MGGGAKSSTSQTLTFEPETAEALQSELSTYIGQLQPLQREQFLRYASLLPNQPGAAGATPLIDPQAFAPLEASKDAAQDRLNLPIGEIAAIGEGLKGGAATAQNLGYRGARDVSGSLTSFIDPSFANILSPSSSTSTQTGIDPLTTGVAAAGAAAAIAIAVVAI